MTRAHVGVVVIGRNEGDRLRACLASLAGRFDTIVYVDSGSTDGSVLFAANFGACVIQLDPTRPFTAARARNAGFKRLVQLAPQTEFVQFIDGDCELAEGWPGAGVSYLGQDLEAAVVAGSLQERFPERSAFNRLCEMEWNTPFGEVQSCGGIALMRRNAFEDVGGFDRSLVAGEEPDLCFRLRSKGWKIQRIDYLMATHDAAMYRIGQWWQRAKRSGFADGEAAARRGDSEPHLQRKVRSNLFWASPIAWPLWPLLWLKVASQRGALYATHIVAGKVPHAVGQCKYWAGKARRIESQLIEHK